MKQALRIKYVYMLLTELKLGAGNRFITDNVEGWEIAPQNITS